MFCFFCFERLFWQMSLGFLQVMSLDSSLQTVTQQKARLKSDLRVTQQERDALKQKVISLHKQLQAANEKVSTEDPSFCHLLDGDTETTLYLPPPTVTIYLPSSLSRYQLLEVSVVSASQQQGRRVWAELSGLMEAEHASLTEENQQLKRQISEISSEQQSLKEQVSACLLNPSGSHRRCASN